MAATLKNIALVGAGGILGSRTLEALLKHGKHNVNVITRPSSKSEYPSSVNVKQGDYQDAAFLEAALQGQDVLVSMLGFAGLPDQHAFFHAAAKAGVKYVLPAEYGAPSGNDAQVKAAPLIQLKRNDHELIESLGIKWIGVVTNPWIDYCIRYGVFDINVPEKKATVYTDGAPFSTTSMGKVAEGIASLLCLSETEIQKEFANNFLYLSSFTLTHPEIFLAILRVTGTTEADWQVEKSTTKDLVDEGWRMVNGGEPAGHFKIVFGAAYTHGLGGDYSELLHNERLGLGEEDLETVVKAAVDAAKPGGFTAGTTLKLK
ncbi:uncharacterized protein LTR77_001630 [Saxophila tyrrhenica]|uniref:NmrA-like domain-containing protein n=1 Tax=Saxophila tyrrhenica TaxID=1690608 RepID=A0AAV9PP81_9PEZI|nr:hypothetical protein LTR77_001630 [Saxophila tyrrhenica]